MVKETNLIAQTSVGGVDMSALRRSARENSPEALKAVAQQFEALLMNEMLKSMRAATPKGGLFDNEETRLYTSLLDQQISQNFAKRGVGLADALLKQMTINQGTSVPTGNTNGKTALQETGQSLAENLKLQQANSLSSGSLDNTGTTGANSDRLTALLGSLSAYPAALQLSDQLQGTFFTRFGNKQNVIPSATVTDADATSSVSRRSRPAHVQAFQERLSSHAEEASRATGIPAKFMLGQAALESGWGKKVMRTPDGSNSHNLFGIKATNGWRGKVVETTTTEYVSGVAYRKKEKFRAYDSYADSFKDYARLLKSNPRYKNVLENSHDAASFAQGLQRAGYATDPRYAAKLTSIIEKSLSA